MRIHFVLNGNGELHSKLADVEIHFEEGTLAGLKLAGCSVWRSRKGEKVSVLVPSRSYATANGVRYYELLRASGDDNDGKNAVKAFKDYIREQYEQISAPVAANSKKDTAANG